MSGCEAASAELARVVPMRRTLFVSSIGIHTAIVVGLVVTGAWRLDQLEMVKPPDPHIAMGPPPDPASGPAPRALPFVAKRQTRTKVTVQPPDHPIPAAPEAPDVASTRTTPR